MKSRTKNVAAFWSLFYAQPRMNSSQQRYGNNLVLWIEQLSQPLMKSMCSFVFDPKKNRVCTHGISEKRIRGACCRVWGAAYAWRCRGRWKWGARASCVSVRSMCCRRHHQTMCTPGSLILPSAVSNRHAVHVESWTPTSLLYSFKTNYQNYRKFFTKFHCTA